MIKRPHNFKDLTGEKFNFITVKYFHKAENKKDSRWICICDCGKETECSATQLKNNRKKSCGCWKSKEITNRLYKGGKYITGQEFCNIKARAVIRNLDFNITIEDIEEVYEKQDKKCVLSGTLLEFNTTISKGENGKIINGHASVDRIDSLKGYTKDNIQIVHKDINIAKQAKTDVEFIEMCCKIADYQRNK